MFGHWAKIAACAAGAALLAGCGVTQGKLDQELNQRTTELKAYADQKVGASESTMRKDIADVRAASEANRERAEAILKTVESHEANIRHNRETLRSLLEAQSQALDQEKRAVDALLERFKAATDAPGAALAPQVEPPPSLPAK